MASHYETAVDDEMREQWQLPQWILDMVAKGYLGEKTGGSFFREKRTLVIDPATLEYRPWQDPRQPSLAEANKISDPVERVRKFISFDDAAARFGWDLLAATFVYSANRVPEICDDIAQIDRGMRWGYAWDLGPFELWDALGVKETVARMQAEGRAVPEWVVALAASDDPLLLQEGRRRARPPTARRRSTRRWPRGPAPISAGRPQGGRQDPGRDRRPPVSSTWATGWPASSSAPRPNMMTEDVHHFIEKILADAGRDYDALVIGNQGSHFSGGADLKMMVDRITGRRLRRHRRHSCATCRRRAWPSSTRPSRWWPPRSAACWAAASRSACIATASRPTPTSAWAWSRPAWASSRRRAASRNRCSAPWTSLKGVTWPFPNLMPTFEALAQAKISGSAWEAFDLNYMRQGDGVTMNRESVIYAAKQVALRHARGRLAAARCRPRSRSWAATASATSAASSTTWARASSSPSTTATWARRSPTCCSGGDVDPQTEVDEWHLLDLERKAFLEVCRTPKTLERIQAMLTTGKPAAQLARAAGQQGDL